MFSWVYKHKNQQAWVYFKANWTPKHVVRKYSDTYVELKFSVLSDHMSITQDFVYVCILVLYMHVYSQINDKRDTDWDGLNDVHYMYKWTENIAEYHDVANGT